MVREIGKMKEMGKTSSMREVGKVGKKQRVSAALTRGSGRGSTVTTCTNQEGY